MLDNQFDNVLKFGRFFFIYRCLFLYGIGFFSIVWNYIWWFVKDELFLLLVLIWLIWLYDDLFVRTFMWWLVSNLGLNCSFFLHFFWVLGKEWWFFLIVWIGCFCVWGSIWQTQVWFGWNWFCKIHLVRNYLSLKLRVFLVLNQVWCKILVYIFDSRQDRIFSLLVEVFNSRLIVRKLI